ncbi:hypothetical protein [Novosphingobium sp.]|uniref:hypothetical protein n=1 Tax=Novosphingobium sp. TaxID=1874826 RepID=UPI003B525CD5
MLQSFGHVALLLALLAAPAEVWAQAGNTVQSPVLKVGDSWVFNDVTEKGPTGYNERRTNIVVQRLGDDTMNIGIKRDGAPGAFEDQLIGLDWSHRRFVDGKQTVTTRPFEFPLSVGHQWTVDFVDSTRRGNQISVHVRQTYKVVGWEDITVAGGHFHTVKVVSDGVNDGTVEVAATAGTSVAASSSGTAAISHGQRGGIGKLVRVTHGEFYYAPEIKSAVKSLEEQYSPDNVLLIREKRELVSFTPGN